MEKKLLLSEDEVGTIRKYLSIIRQDDLDREKKESRIHYSMGELGRIEEELGK